MAGGQVKSADKVLANISFLFGVAIWATMFPSTEYLLNSWDPVSVAFARLSGGGVILFIVFAMSGGFRVALETIAWNKVFLLGIVGVSLSTLLLTLGIKLSSSLTAALVATTGPILATLLMRIVYSEPLRRGIFIGITLAVSGGIFAVMGGDTRIDNIRGGEIFILMGISLWHWYSYNCQRWLPNISQVGIAALTVTAGALGLAAYIIFTALLGIYDMPAGPTRDEWLILGWLSVGPACLSIFLWHFGVSRVGVTVGSMYQNLVPIVVVLISISLGQYPNTLHLIGGVLIISGVLYIQTRNVSPFTKQNT